MRSITAAAACCFLTTTATASIPPRFGVSNRATFGALTSRGGSTGAYSTWIWQVLVDSCSMYDDELQVGLLSLE